jgi:hypothetical protein
LVRNLLGPGARRAGDALRDLIYIRRVEGTIKYAKKVQDRLCVLGLNRQYVALKLLVRTMEEGSLEDHD